MAYVSVCVMRRVKLISRQSLICIECDHWEDQLRKMRATKFDRCLCMRISMGVWGVCIKCFADDYRVAFK